LLPYRAATIIPAPRPRSLILIAAPLASRSSRYSGEHPVREVHRIGLRLGRYRPEILARRPEDVPDRAVAVVDAVEHRLGGRDMQARAIFVAKLFQVAA
jgi:hypothetical protein